MLKAVVNQGERTSRKVGFVDGPHVILKCSACSKPLVDLWRVHPDERDPLTGKVFEWSVIAHCCYCGDHSFIEKVEGHFVPGGYGRTHPEDKEASIMETVVVDIKEDADEVIHFYTHRAGK